MKKFKATTKAAISTNGMLAAVNWTPKFFADIDDKAEDGDYLRVQQCCTGCGAYIGDLAGAYYLEDCDTCPTCRAASGGEKWSDEVKRIIKRQKMPKDDQKELIEAMAEYANV